jgi:hypothetical protein
MGAIADGFAAYAQPLLDQTDGSIEDMNRALSLAQLCFNLALLPIDRREESLNEMRPTLKMSDEEFAEFRRGLVDPMIRRHEEMFPRMHNRGSDSFFSSEPAPRAQSNLTVSTEAKPKIDRYAPCPCGSGEKYKFCCGAKRR